MNPISSTTQMAPWSDIASGRRISIGWSCQVHPLHLSQLCPAGVLERYFSAVSLTITDARSRLSSKTVEAMELVRWAVRGSLLNMDDLTIWFSLTWHLLLAILAKFYFVHDITVVIVERGRGGGGGGGNGVFFVDGLGWVMFVIFSVVSCGKCGKHR